MKKILVVILVILLAISITTIWSNSTGPDGAGQNNGVRGLAPDYHGGASGPSARPHGPTGE